MSVLSLFDELVISDIFNKYLILTSKNAGNSYKNALQNIGWSEENLDIATKICKHTKRSIIQISQRKMKNYFN